ncbi:hypothetical protein M422DRAFT_95085, partial [Sphaerobolus stellatus SS14]
TGLFLFDNAPSHQKQAPDALSARKMPKGPAEGWTHHKDGPRMRNGWFKGMEVLIKERGLCPESGLNAQCPGFKCQKGNTNCCCQRILFTQPDFQSQKSQLEEYITSQNHICDFYPK